MSEIRANDAAARPGVTSIEGVTSVTTRANRFRRKRFQIFLRQLETICAKSGTVRVLDVGGTRAYWEAMRDLWSHLQLDVTLVNIGAVPSDEGIYHYRGGDARDLADYKSGSFDIVHSNSVIEHVGYWADMMAMAKEVRRLAPRYYVQTPNFWFPFEPHYKAPLIHWLPETTRARLLVGRRVGFCGPEPDLDHAMRTVQAIQLLTSRQMRELFPDALIGSEHILGMAKSLLAIR